jgi:hypothetical protein
VRNPEAHDDGHQDHDVFELAQCGSPTLWDPGRCWANWDAVWGCINDLLRKYRTPNTVFRKRTFQLGGATLLGGAGRFSKADRPHRQGKTFQVKCGVGILAELELFPIEDSG